MRYDSCKWVRVPSSDLAESGRLHEANHVTADHGLCYSRMHLIQKGNAFAGLRDRSNDSLQPISVSVADCGGDHVLGQAGSIGSLRRRSEDLHVRVPDPRIHRGVLQCVREQRRVLINHSSSF